jgi:membrane protein DedA with SNARE-associated domain
MGSLLWYLFCVVSGALVGFALAHITDSKIIVAIVVFLVSLFYVYLGSILDYSLLPK